MEGIIDILMVIEDYSHYDLMTKKWFMSKEEPWKEVEWRRKHHWPLLH